MESKKPFMSVKFRKILMIVVFGGFIIGLLIGAVIASRESEKDEAPVEKAVKK